MRNGICSSLPNQFRSTLECRLMRPENSTRLPAIYQGLSMCSTCRHQHTKMPVVWWITGSNPDSVFHSFNIHFNYSINLEPLSQESDLRFYMLSCIMLFRMISRYVLCSTCKHCKLLRMCISPASLLFRLQSLSKHTRRHRGGHVDQ